MAKRDNNALGNIDWGTLSGFVEPLSVGDKCWLYRSEAHESDNEVVITSPTLGFSEEIANRFKGLLVKYYKKQITFKFLEVGAKQECEIAHTQRLNRLNPHQSSRLPSCSCYGCTRR